MTSKYGLANESIETLNAAASSANIDCGDVQEAMLVTLVQALKQERGVDYLRSFLQYEIDMLGSGSLHEIPRGIGHS